MLDAVKTHLPLLAVAALAALLVLYLYRELQKTKRALAEATAIEPAAGKGQHDGPEPPNKRAKAGDPLDPVEVVKGVLRRPGVPPATLGDDAR